MNHENIVISQQHFQNHTAATIPRTYTTFVCPCSKNVASVCLQGEHLQIARVPPPIEGGLLSTLQRHQRHLSRYSRIDRATHYKTPRHSPHFIYYPHRVSQHDHNQGVLCVTTYNTVGFIFKAAIPHQYKYTQISKLKKN